MSDERLGDLIALAIQQWEDEGATFVAPYVAGVLVGLANTILETSPSMERRAWAAAAAIKVLTDGIPAASLAKARSEFDALVARSLQ